MTPEIFVVSTDADYQQSLEIRREVFVSEQGVPAELEVDEFEQSSVHFLCRLGDVAVATGRLRRKDSYCKFERIATLAAYRGHGYGILLMQFMQDYARAHYPELAPYMHAQTPAVGFYEKLGWRKTGAEFYEAGISHFAMTK